MQNRFLLGISVGESFAEFSLLSGDQPLAHKRIFLARENLKSSLQQFLADHQDKTPLKVFISLRFSEKLLDQRFSGAIAQVTTEGFENWLNLRRDPKYSLNSKDLSFAINERVRADGTIEKPLDFAELEAIATKLQLVQCKKICLYFLHSNTNPEHTIKAQSFFTDKGFEVFIPERTDNSDEVSRWNKNSLNAAISGVIEELQTDLAEALSTIPSEDIHYINSEGKLFERDAKDNPLASLFSLYTALAQTHTSKEASDILYLGLESFVLISGDKWNKIWQSPWGETEVSHPWITKLKLQPTSGLDLNIFERIDFMPRNEGWEPGPMFLGRGQKLTLLDLWSENAKLAKVPGLEDRIAASGVQRFKNSLLALSKVSRNHNNDQNHVIKDLQSLAMQRMALQSRLDRQSERIVITGPLAEIFGNAFKKDKKAKVVPQAFTDATATALLGLRQLKDRR